MAGVGGVRWDRIAPEVWSRYGKVILGMAAGGKVEVRREDDGGRSWRLAPWAPEGPGAGPEAVREGEARGRGAKR